MANGLVRVWISKDLKEGMEDLRRGIAIDMKREYNLEEVTVSQTLSSQILAAKLQGKKYLDIRIRKNGLNSGVLEIV